MIAEKVDSQITSWSKLIAMFIFGWMASSSWHDTYVSDKAKAVLPAVEAEAGCEHWRAGVASKLALGSDFVVPSEIPKDCAHPKVDGPPAEHPVPK